MPRPVTLPRLALALVAAGMLAGCGSNPSWNPSTWFSRDAKPTGATPRELHGVEARIKAIGSSVNGVVRVRESGDLFVMRADFGGLTPGSDYRLVFHENGNCSSPNAFSAGAPWSPPGSTVVPAQLIPAMRASSEGSGIITVRLKGVRMGGDGGLLKRSVVIYQGYTAEPLRPGVPNNAVGCGVFEPSQALF
jgi:Cu-Zn family superoxide dismutase